MQSDCILQEATCPSLQISQEKCLFKFLRHKYEFVDTYLLKLNGHWISAQKGEMDLVPFFATM